MHQVESRHLVAFAVLILAQTELLASPTVGQEQVDLDRFRSCESCLAMEETLALGTAEPPGAIRHEAARVAYSEELGVFAVWVRSRPEIDLYERSGRFLRTIGPDGEGPGETQAVMAVRFAGRSLYVWDARLGRLTRFSIAQSAFEDFAVQVTGVNDIEVLSTGEVVFAASIFTREAAGYPLHVVDLEDPSAILRTGSASGAWNASEPWGQAIHSTLAPNGRVWIARMPRLEFLEWSRDEGVERHVAGAPRWFPPVVDTPRQGEAPRSRLDDLVVDAEGRVWTLTRVAGSNWRSGLGEAGELGFPRIVDRAAYADHRVDVFDLAEGLHAGHLLVDNPVAQLVVVDGVAHLSEVKYDSAMTPRLTLSRLSVTAR